MLAVDGLEKTYGSVRALRGVSLQVSVEDNLRFFGGLAGLGREGPWRAGQAVQPGAASSPSAAIASIGRIRSTQACGSRQGAISTTVLSGGERWDDAGKHAATFGDPPQDGCPRAVERWRREHSP